MDRIRSGEALRPSVVEWLSEHLAPARLRPVFLAGAAGCALWIGFLLVNPGMNAGPKGDGQLAGTSPKSEQTATSNAPVPSSAITTPAAPGGDVVASAPARVAPSSTGSVPAALEGTASASGPADSAQINAPYQDEYILDQFYLNRSGEDGVHSIVPVSGRTTDDVYITF